MCVLVNIRLEDYMYFGTKRLARLAHLKCSRQGRSYIRRKLCTNQSSLGCATLVRLLAANSRQLVKRAAHSVDRGLTA